MSANQIRKQQAVILTGKYLWKVLKNRSNEIRSNEIRIRRELPVPTYM